MGTVPLMNCARKSIKYAGKHISAHITHIKIFIISIDKYFYMCYYIIVRMEKHENLFFKGSDNSA